MAAYLSRRSPARCVQRQRGGAFGSCRHFSWPLMNTLTPCYAIGSLPVLRPLGRLFEPKEIARGVDPPTLPGTVYFGAKTTGATLWYLFLFFFGVKTICWNNGCHNVAPCLFITAYLNKGWWDIWYENCIEKVVRHRPEYASIYDSMKFFAFNATTRGIQH